jgi:subtilase family serine protease
MITDDRETMNRRISIFALAALAAGAAVTASPALGHAAATPGPVKLPGSAAPFNGAATIGSVPGKQKLTVELWLRPRSVTGPQTYAADASTPGNKLFRHYLSPAAYTARFGATEADAHSVESWLGSSGFTGVTADPGRDYVRATAPVSAIETAFATQLKYYRPSGHTTAGPNPLRGNDRPVSLPATIAARVIGVTGLDNEAPRMSYVRPDSGPSVPGVHGAPLQPASSEPASSDQPAGKAPTAYQCSSYYNQHSVGRMPREFGVARFPTPVCGYTAAQLRQAYGLAKPDTGTGTTIALIEVGLTPNMFQTLADYASTNHIQVPSSHRYRELSLGQGSACGDPFNDEEQLDVESSYAMAPAADQLVIGGDSCDNGDAGLQALFNSDTKVLASGGSHPLASIVSNSWEGLDESQPVSYTVIEHAYLVRAAAEGVGMYFSSGDSSGVETPSSDPYATAVGGTTLGIGASGNRVFETGWSTGTYADTKSAWVSAGEQGAAGGGPSVLWQQPSYQKGVVPAALARAAGNRGGLVRAVPDISADADPFTGFAVGTLTTSTAKKPVYSETAYGGTSLAAPLVASIVADAQQGQAHPFGFINPVLYRNSGTSALHDALPVTSEPIRDRAVACDSSACGGLGLDRFDVQATGMAGYTGQVTQKGYDTMTGLGTPNGQSFIAALRRG